MSTPIITLPSGQDADSFYARIVQAEEFDFHGVDHQLLIKDFHGLPKSLQEESMDLLQDGYPSPFVATFIMVHRKRGKAQNLKNQDWLFRIELLRRFYVVLAPGAIERTAKDWKVYLGLTTDEVTAKVVSPATRTNCDGSSPPVAPPPELPPCPERFLFNRDDADILFRKYGRLPCRVQSQVTERLLACDCTEAVSRPLLNQPELGELQHATLPELLRLVEHQRRLLHHGFGNPFYGFQGNSQNRVNRSWRANHAEAAAATERHAELVWHISLIPLPLYQAFLRVVVAGGAVEQAVLRCSRRLKEGVEDAADASDVGSKGHASAPGQATKKRKKNPDSGFRTQKGDGMLRTLAHLPSHVLEESIRLLAHGVKATIVTRFILSHDDFGNFRPLASGSLRQYLQYLATKVTEEGKPSADRMRLIHQVAKQIRMQQVRQQLVQLARRVAAQAKGEAGEAIHVREVESLASIKQQLAALFVTDTDQLLADLLALQRKSS